MKLMNQPFNGQLGSELVELLDSGSYHTLNIVVAFAKCSGVLKLKESLESFKKRGGVINVYVGVDLGVTSYEALSALLLCTNSLAVVHSEGGQTFHTKVYQFVGNDKGTIVVGSHNLTGGGLWTNFESSVHISLEMSNPKDVELLKKQEEYFTSLTSLGSSFMPITKSDDLDRLLKNGYVEKEVSQQFRIPHAGSKNEVRERLFGNGFPAKLPSSDIPSGETSAEYSASSGKRQSEPRGSESEVIWFETRKLTGGSRNILDLSMKSLVERGEPAKTSFDLGEPGFMRGGVEFFGINPTEIDVRKNITLHFEGVDYFDNAILFPEGDGANGTWRLQIRGVSSSNVKITDAFRSKGEEYYLVEKVVTFSKIKDDYYSISVYPESELEYFRSASSILARNGSTKNAKQLGIL